MAGYRYIDIVSWPRIVAGTPEARCLHLREKAYMGKSILQMNKRGYSGDSGEGLAAELAEIASKIVVKLRGRDAAARIDPFVFS